MTITLPYPPSVNTYWRSVNGRNILSAKGRAYRRAAAVALLGARSISGPVGITLTAFVPDRRQRDPDNVLKALIDALTHGGVIDDDDFTHLPDLRILYGGLDRDNPRVEVELTPHADH